MAIWCKGVCKIRLLSDVFVIVFTWQMDNCEFHLNNHSQAFYNVVIAHLEVMFKTGIRSIIHMLRILENINYIYILYIIFGAT